MPTHWLRLLLRHQLRHGEVALGLLLLFLTPQQSELKSNLLQEWLDGVEMVVVQSCREWMVVVQVEVEVEFEHGVDWLRVGVEVRQLRGRMASMTVCQA